MARYAKSLGFAERSTAPATPADGNVEVYLKNDGKLYKKDDTGTESEVGGGIMGEGTPISGTSGALTVTMDGTVKLLIIEGDCTLTPSDGIVGQTCTIMIYDGSGSEHIVNFGPDFFVTSAVTTVANSVISVSFIYHTESWVEISRSGAVAW